ncbi:MAG: helix-turn-helix domain-containing protein [Candidatus Bipolaricaulia bacterium]
MAEIEAYLKPWQVARYLGFSVDTIYKMLERGEIPGEKIGDRWRIRKTALERWLDEQVTPEMLIEMSKQMPEISDERIAELLNYDVEQVRQLRQDKSEKKEEEKE